MFWFFFYSYVKGRVLVVFVDGIIFIFYRDIGILFFVFFYVNYILLFVLSFIIYCGVIIFCGDLVVMNFMYINLYF